MRISPTAAYRLLVHVRRKGECLFWKGKSWAGGFRLYHEHDHSPVEPSIASWILWRGAMPKGRRIVRTCGNLRCIAPGHLEAVTPKEFAARFPVRTPPRGVDSAAHRVSGHQVYAARVSYAAGLSLLAIKRRLGIAPRTAWLLISGRTWAHIGGPVGTRSRQEAAALRYGRAE